MALSKIDVANMLTGTIPVDNSKSGSILQVQSTFYNTPFTQSITANTLTGIDNLTVNITPSSTSSKIMLFCRLFCEHSNDATYETGYFFRRGSTQIGSGVSEGSRAVVMASHGVNYMTGSGTYDATSTAETVSLFHIDASHSSTSQITYSIGYRAVNAGTLAVNRTINDSDSNLHERGSSEIIAMEIKG
jgi:hypothetical protein